METLNLQPPSLEWRVYRNDNSVMTLVLVNSNDAALDLTDWTFTGKVREFPTDASVLTTLTIVKNENILTIALTNAGLPQMSYFDIQGVNSTNSNVSTVIRGQIFVEEDVTR
jgi:hypothetical protein